MGAKYSITGQEPTPASSDPTSVVGVILDSGVTVRPRVFDLIVASDAAAADNSAGFHFKRFTAAGTATTVAPVALDPAEPTAVGDGRDTYTVDSAGFSDILLHFALNQRATFRWVAAPGSELIIPATVNNGLVLTTPVVNSMGALVSTILYEE